MILCTHRKAIFLTLKKYGVRSDVVSITYVLQLLPFEHIQWQLQVWSFHHFYVNFLETIFLLIETLKFQDEDDFQYDILLLLSSARTWTSV